MLLKNMLIFLMAILLGSCGSINIADCSYRGFLKALVHCSQPTDDEKAMLALNAGDAETAQAILEPLIAAHPLDYFRYPRLAAAYALQASVDVLTIATSNQGGSDSESSSGGSPLQSIGKFLPTATRENLPEYKVKVGLLNQAKNLLLSIPDEVRGDASIAYSGSAAFQLLLYQLSYSIMFMNQFTIPISTDSKALDPSILASMTTEDATNILSNLSDALDVAGAISPENSEKIKDVLSTLNTQDGQDNREKLMNYLQQHPQQ